MLRNLSIRTGLLTLLAVMAFLLLLVSAMGIYSLTQSSASLQRINALQGEKMMRLNEGYTLLLRARNEAGQAVRLMEIGMVDDAATSIKTIAGELVRGQQLLKTVLTGDVDDEQGALLLSKLNQSFNALNSQGLAPMMAALNKQSPDDYYDLLGNGLIPLTRAFDNDVHAFQRWGEARGSREVASVLTQKQVMLALIGLVALLTAAIMTLVWLALRHLLLRPLEQSVEQLEHVAAGDLTRALTATSNNELGRLISAIETMRLSLAESVMRVRDASAQIDTGSRELAAGNVDLAQRTESTATSLEQTAASMEQITATVKQNADNAGMVHQLAKAVSDTADRGSEMVCYVIEKMRDISGSSNRIGDILSVIDAIAFQTNILALNAAVEAARAGEQGAGLRSWRAKCARSPAAAPRRRKRSARLSVIPKARWARAVSWPCRPGRRWMKSPKKCCG